MNRQKVELEVCIAADDLSSMSRDIKQARDNGAQRIELCASMNVDGLTPSMEAIARARDLLAEQILLVMVRPREGGFVYSEKEHDTSLAVVSLAKSYGADGVVCGPLDVKGNIALNQLQALTGCAKKLGLTTTFHRAFDALEDRFTQWHRLIDAGVDRVLTSGTPWRSELAAIRGLDVLTRLPSVDGSPELVIGGGVSIDNAREILTPTARVHNRLSLHAYSGVMTGGSVDGNKVRALAELCEQFS